MKNITLVGIGAIGSVYGALLLNNSNLKVTVLVDEERKRRYVASPVYLNNKIISFDYVTPKEVTETADFVIIATKYGQLSEAISLLTHSIGENTKILSLLNGIKSEKDLKKAFGGEKVFYGMCNGLDATRKGRHIEYTSSGKISFGEADNSKLNPYVRQLAEIFQMSGIQYDIPENMLQTLWYKFMVNVGVNQITAITRSSYGVIQNNKESQLLIRQAMLEVIQLARLENIVLTEKMIDEWFTTVLSPLHPTGKTSMLQDIEQGRSTEVDLFSGEVLNLANKHGISTPLNEMLYRMIKTLEYRNEYFS